MLYGMFRLGIGFIIAIVLFVLIKYTKTIDKRKCCIAAFIAVSITVSLLYLIPFENAFITFSTPEKTSVYKGYKQDKIEMRGDRAEMSDFPLYLNTVAGGLDRRDQTIGGFSFVVKIYAVPVVEIIG